MVRIFILIYSIILNVEAKETASVVFQKGHVFVVDRDTKTKSRLLKNGLVRSGSLVETGARSMVRLKFKDGSSITLGPNGQIVVARIESGDTKIIGLLRGKLRSKLLPATNAAREKMIIKTRSAALGVRGTDLLTVYNEQNHITSTVTFSGDVTFFKRDDVDIEETIQSERDEDGEKYEMLEFIDQDYDLGKLRNNLVSNESRTVASGSYSGAFPGHDKASRAVKINPVQFNILKKNKNVVLRNSGKVLKNKKKGNTSLSNVHLIPTPQGEVPLVIDKDDVVIEEKSLNIRSGGNLDLDTGIYVAPPKNAVYDKKNGVYRVPEELGGIDERSGNYIAPDGLQLHPLNGFVFLTEKLKQFTQYAKLKLQKLVKLQNKYNRKLIRGLQYLKKLTRLDVRTDVNYLYTNNVVEDYYGEKRQISNTDAFMWDLEGFVGRHAFHNKRYLIYPKMSGSMKLHSRRDAPDVKRNDSANVMVGVEVHRNHIFFGKKGRLVLDVTQNTHYRDFRNLDQFDFYTEDSKLALSESYQVSPKQKIKLGGGVQFFQGHVDTDHGMIKFVDVDYQWQLAKRHFMGLHYGFKKREDNINENIILLNRYQVSYQAQNIMRKIDFHWRGRYQVVDLRKEIGYKIARLVSNKISLERRKGDYLKFSVFYQYDRQKATLGSKYSFVQHSYGGGFYFIF
ncbi:FecR domain-containing protein [Bacteriovoracaceae bacterium]|nr:FecR domain-containing protein [Bacteriovoracaceae bacterium]